MKKQKTAINVLLFAAILVMISCSNATNDIASVKIGTQIWATKNLDVSTFSNGDPIPEAKTSEEWIKLGDEQKPAWCYYNNDPSNGEIYGKLYNWYAVNDPRGLAPEGWHIPTNSEWITLTTYIEEAGGKLKETGTAHWYIPNEGATNETGFTALPGGARQDNGADASIGDYGLWWSATEYSTSTAYFRDMSYKLIDVSRSYGKKVVGCSVRCVKGVKVEDIMEPAKVEVNPVETDTVQKNITLPVIPGIYKSGYLFLAFDGEYVTGFYSNGKYEGNPNFGCSFYFYGNSSDTIEDRMIRIKVLNPFDLSKQPRDGTFKLHSEEDNVFYLVANLAMEDCWDRQLDFAEIGTPPGVDFEITEKKDWIEIRIADSQKVYFYDSKEDSTIRKTYVVIGDPLYISEQDGDWLMATYKGSKSETKGWIKKSDTKSFMEISTSGKN